MNIKERLNLVLKIFIGGVLAGLFIGLGGFINLAVNSVAGENEVVLAKVIGAFLFASGLLATYIFGFYLFTGQVGSSFKKKPKFILKLFIMLIGNIIGTFLIGGLVACVSSLEPLKELAINYINIKQARPLWEMLLLAIGCGFCMEFAVMGYKELKDQGIIKIVPIFLGVALFILCGFEHIIANFFYMFASFNFNISALQFLMMLLGNSIGAIFLSALFTWFKKLSNKN